MADNPLPPDIRRQMLRWTGLQFALGQAQMIGAVVTLYLILTTGLSEWAVAACVLTSACYVASRLIFQGRSAADMVRPRKDPPSSKTDDTP